jgi:uncharacterized protein (TIGR03083 family)
MTSEPTTTPPPLDLHPAADEVARIVAGVRDDHLGGTTPCPDYPVAALLDHLMGLCIAFTQAARKQPMPAELAAAWDEPGAWAGEATAGGVTMPAPAMGAVALDEVAVHGWDLARATGQDYRLDDATVAAVLAFTTESATPENEPMRAGVFGPVVEVPADAPAWDRAMGLAGRDPGWRP